MSLSRTLPQLSMDTAARRLDRVDARALARDGLAISWYGPAGYAADRPASEASIQAICGLMEVNGRDARRPRRVGLEVASVAAGLLAAQGALAAEIARLRGRPVPEVRTSVLQAGLLLLSNYFVVATALGDALPGPPLPEPGPPFASADGRWFEIETLDPEPWKEFWARLGLENGVAGRAWRVFQWRYERATCSFPPGLHEATRARSLAELQDIAAATRVSLVPLRGYADVLGRLEDAAHPLVRVGSGEGRRPAPAPPPASSTTTTAKAWRPDDGLPLAGIRVVEATSRIQGPLAGMLLRMLGADVVRVQPPEGDYGRAAMCLHREKAAVQLDLGTPGGRAQLVELVTGADVFLHNWRPGKADEWGLTFDDLSASRPGLVYCHTSGWGERPQSRRLIGTDFLVQAHAAMGEGLHPEREPPFPSRVVLCDLVGALVGAEGILAGLYRRELGGGACEVRSSLLAGAMAQQAHVLSDIVAGKEVGRRNGRPVWGVLDVPVDTADGLLTVSVEDDESFEGLCQLGDVDPADAPRAVVERRLASRLGERTASDWEARLVGAGIPAAVVCQDLAALPADPRLAGLFEPVGTGFAPRSPWSFS